MAKGIYNSGMSILPLTSVAKDVLVRHQAGPFPLHVVSIAHEIGADVLSDSTYSRDGSGHTELNQDGSVSIIINDKQSYGRKRFTIAHEIAHRIMDMDYLEKHRTIDRDGDARDESYRSRERRANEFAAELLMPEKTYVEQWITLADIDKISDYFGVSKAAAQWRAINLGLDRAE